MATFNTEPTRADVLDSETNQSLGEKQHWSLVPGQVGRWDENGNFIPSQFDFFNAVSVGRGPEFSTNRFVDEDTNINANNFATFALKDGSKILYDAKEDKVLGMSAPTSAWTRVAGEDLNGNFFGYPNIPADKKATFQGVSDIPMLYEPMSVTRTGQYLGHAPTLTKDTGGFSNWITDNGWMIPLAMIGAGAGAAALGGEAALGGAGAAAAETGGTAAGADVFGGLAGTTGEIGGGAVSGGAAGGGAGGINGALESYLGTTGGTYVPAEGFSATLPGYGSTGSVIGDQIGDYPMPGESGTASQWTPSNINPADVDKLLNYNAAYANTGMTASEALSAANKARQTYSAANTLSKLLSGGATTAKNAGSSTSQQQIADYLRSLSQPVSSMYAGQIKGNQNPFLFATPGQTQAAEGTYDVSGSNLANALRKA